MYEVERTEEEIDRVLNKVDEAENSGHSKWPAMTYEQGIKNALLWLFGDYKDSPMED